MIIGRYSVLYRTPARLLGGLQGNDPAAFKSNGRALNRFTSADWSSLSGVPDGYRPPYTWVLPQIDGTLGARNMLVGTGTLSASGALGKNALAALAGSGVLSATGQLIVSAVADLTGSGTISTANLLAVLQATAALTGSGALAADVTALGWMLSDLAGSSVASGVSYATGNMEADIQPFTELSPQSLADAVWSAIAADNDESGTMGQKLNAAGSAGDPWTTALPGAYAPGTAGDIIGNIAAIILDEASGVETAVTMREALRLILAASAGKLSGAAGTTVIIRNVGDTKDRITATVDADGNRTAVVTDLT